LLIKQQQLELQHQQSRQEQNNMGEQNGNGMMSMGSDDGSEHQDDSQNESNKSLDKAWDGAMKSTYNLDCRICGFTFFHKKDLRKHMLVHANEKTFQCHLCGKSFASATAMNKHITNHNQAKPYKCNKCNRAFATQEKLIKHGILHDASARLNSFVCTTCSVPFTRYSNLMRHCLAQNHPAPPIDSFPPREKVRQSREQTDTPVTSVDGTPVAMESMSNESGQVDPVSKAMKKRDCHKWTEMEDNWLINGVREFGKGHWKEILEKYKNYFQHGRNRFTLRLRYSYLCKIGRADSALEPNLAPAIEANLGRTNAG